MDATGLWAIAASAPDRAAVIEPGGRAVSYAELAAEADRIGRGLQGLGLVPGDTVATLLPNSATTLAAFFAAIQTGLYIVPVNWHLIGAEVGYILADSGARAFLAHERFAAAAVQAADAAGVTARYAAGAIDGFQPLAALGADTEGRPGSRTAGAPMLYT
ncbi:MAG: AMP-binding protein, partial [Streptosporangiaceae bacterium]